MQIIEADKLFEQVADYLVGQNENVSPGRMTFAPGKKYKDKVFAFYCKDAMVFLKSEIG